jgi:hypothetical protein
MDLNLDEQNLIAEFRRLDTEGQLELLDHAAVLLKKQHDKSAADQSGPSNQCALNKPREERPEAAKEPIFTE